MAFWNPWRGCRRYSEGCLFCYIHKGDKRRGRNTEDIIKTEDFDAPVRRDKNGEYLMKPSGTVYLCFSSDFLLEEADAWRAECWQMIKERQDLHFLFLTKRILRFMECIPADWGKGYPNVTVGCTVENEACAAERLGVFCQLPICHRNIICQPLLGPIALQPYLSGIELVVVGGESDRQARPLDYQWVLSIREECIRRGVPFQFRQCGTHFIKDGREYTLQTKDLCGQAKKAGIDC